MDVVWSAVNPAAVIAKHSINVLLSYVLDWILIFVVAGAGGGLATITGNQHVFAIDDPTISYPNFPDTVSLTALAIACVAAPAAIIGVLALVLTPGPLADGSSIRAPSGVRTLRRKIWEANVGLMGLGVALAGAFFVSQGLKDVAGKPRPNFLARCQPDIGKLQAFAVSGYGLQLDESFTFYNTSVCTQPDQSILDDGFASFPSGHSTIAWAGMLYLSLWLAAKMGIALPDLPILASLSGPARTYYSLTNNEEDTRVFRERIRTSTAAPPLYLIILALVPVGVATYICTTRYADYHHAGFDIICGALIGTFFAVLGAKMYLIPGGRGVGWSWGARSKQHAFYAGFDMGTYTGVAEWKGRRSAGNSSRGEVGSRGGFANRAQPDPSTDVEMGNLGRRETEAESP